MDSQVAVLQESVEALALCMHLSALNDCRQWGLEGAQGALWQPLWVSGRHAALQDLSRCCAHGCCIAMSGE